ncbi:MAG: glycosyltransferase, partial [Thermofilaceae archaeon]
EIYALAHLAADAFAVPSRWEPFGLSAVEAMAAGVPVAASGVGGLKETIVDLRSDPSGGTGYLVPPENPAELARALASLLAVTAREDLEASGVLERAESFGLPKPSLSDSELRARCAARAAVFSWAKAAERLEEIYRDALIRARGA